MNEEELKMFADLKKEVSELKENLIGSKFDMSNEKLTFEEKRDIVLTIIRGWQNMQKLGVLQKDLLGMLKHRKSKGEWFYGYNKSLHFLKVLTRKKCILRKDVFGEFPAKMVFYFTPAFVETNGYKYLDIKERARNVIVAAEKEDNEEVKQNDNGRSVKTTKEY